MPGDHRHDGFQVGQNVPCKHSNDRYALRFQPLIPGAVALCLEGVLCAIDLDAEPSFIAIEIEDVESGRMLPTESKPILPPSQGLPQDHLGKRHLRAKLPCPAYGRLWTGEAHPLRQSFGPTPPPGGEDPPNTRPKIESTFLRW